MARTKPKNKWGVLSRRARVRGLSTQEYVKQLIDDCGGVSKAAREANVTRSALYWWLKRPYEDGDDQHATE